MALAFSGQRLILLLIRYIDSIAFGIYGKRVLAVIAIVGNLNYIVRVVIGSFSDSLAIFLVRRENFCLSKNNIKQIFKSYSLYCSFLFSVVISSLLFVFSEKVISYFVSDQYIILLGVKYLKITCFSYILLAFNSIFLSALEAAGVCKQILTVQLWSLFTHTIIILFTKYYFQNIKRVYIEETLITLAMVNTLVLAFETIILGLAIYTSSKKIQNQKSQNITKVCFCEGNFFTYLSVAMPLLGSQILRGAFVGIRDYVAGHLGVNFIAANSITTIFSQTLSTTACGAALATLVTHKDNFEKGDIRVKKQNIKKFQMIFLAIGILNGILVFASQYFIRVFYNVDENVMAIFKQIIIVSAIVTFIMSYQFPIVHGIIKGYGETKWIFSMDVILTFCFVIPFSLLSLKLFGNRYPWIIFACLKVDHPMRMLLAHRKLSQKVHCTD